MPDAAIVDPALTLSCSQKITSASGMDAFSQLLESYLSTASNPVTDALAYEGLKRISNSLLKAYINGMDLQARTDMALAACLSGVTLANAGFGLVHGFASSIGGFYKIAHGVICSSLMYAVNKLTVRKLRMEKNKAALAKYETIGKLFSNTENKPDDWYTDFLLALIEEWTSKMNISRLGEGGVKSADFEKIVKVTDNKNNPTALDSDEMTEVLQLAV